MHATRVPPQPQAAVSVATIWIPQAARLSLQQIGDLLRCTESVRIEPIAAADASTTQESQAGPPRQSLARERGPQSGYYPQRFGDRCRLIVHRSARFER